MSIYLQFFGNASVWSGILAALRDLPEPDRQLGELIADSVAGDWAEGVRNIDLQDVEDDTARRIARAVSGRVPMACLRLSIRDDTHDVQTVSLFHAGQRLAQRTVSWPRRVGDAPTIEATETESRFTLRVVTDLPIRLDTIINELAVSQESALGEPPTLPIAIAIPEAENSWGRLPGFHPVLAMMHGDNGMGNALEDSLACIRMPTPQSLVFVEAVSRPAAAVFDLEFLVFGLPAGMVRDVFQGRFGSWGQSYLLTGGEPEPRVQRYFIATLSIPLGPETDIDEDWSRLYGLAGQTDAVLGWPGDTNDPHAWADLPGTRFAPTPCGVSQGAAVLIISRRVPLPVLNPESSLIELIRPAAALLPVDACLEIAHAGSAPWFKRFSKQAVADAVAR